MLKILFSGLTLAGLCAGAVNGLFGAGGGMVLIPILTAFGGLEDNRVFSSSVAVILPLCLVSLFFAENLPWKEALPYMAGSAVGGFAAGQWGHRVPTLWLHRVFGGLLLWGGIRYLWPH